MISYAIQNEAGQYLTRRPGYVFAHVGDIREARIFWSREAAEHFVGRSGGKVVEVDV